MRFSLLKLNQIARMIFMGSINQKHSKNMESIRKKREKEKNKETNKGIKKEKDMGKNKKWLN